MFDVIQFGAQERADRYIYIPLIWLSIALVWGLAELLEPHPRLRLALAAAIPIACFALTLRQLPHWRNSESLYLHAIDVVPENYVARYNLAALLEGRGELDPAAQQLRETVRVRPGFAPAPS